MRENPYHDLVYYWIGMYQQQIQHHKIVPSYNNDMTSLASWSPQGRATIEDAPTPG